MQTRRHEASSLVRFVMACGDDDDNAFGALHCLLDEAEAEAVHDDIFWRDRRLSGERLWMNMFADDWHVRGMVPVDVKTRFYRLRRQGGRSTIFIIPAIGHYLATMQGRPFGHLSPDGSATPARPEQVT